MRKRLFILLILMRAMDLHAHGQLGIQMMPGVTFSKISVEPGTSSGISSGPWSGHFQIGLVGDYSFLRDNYCASTGIFYLTQQFSLNNGGVEESYDLSYLQVPMLLKLYTNDLALDVRVYGKLGPVFQFNLGRLLNKQESDLIIKNFKYLGAGLAFGFGVEYEAGFSTSVFFGICCKTELINKINAHKQLESTKGLKGRSNICSIEFGVKF